MFCEFPFTQSIVWNGASSQSGGKPDNWIAFCLHICRFIWLQILQEKSFLYEDSFWNKETQGDSETISFPEPTCLLVSTKTRSSGIINNLVPRAHVSFAFKIRYCCSSTFVVYVWTPCKPRHACATKPEFLKSWSWNWFSQNSVSWCRPKDTWAQGTRLTRKWPILFCSCLFPEHVLSSVL